jgi:Spy/CpxP family protein refolding chaperone
MSKMQELRQGTNNQIKSVLTADQQQKFVQMQDRHGPGMGHGGMGQDGMQAPPQQAPPQQ